MINYQKHTLPNGLTVVVNRDRSSKLAAVNLLYKIGARNENPSRTGFAHLFEHLMFRGTKAVPDFDTPVQMACGGEQRLHQQRLHGLLHHPCPRTTSKRPSGSKATA